MDVTVNCLTKNKLKLRKIIYVCIHITTYVYVTLNRPFVSSMTHTANITILFLGWLYKSFRLGQ